jgi:hypothetical protein
VNPVSLTHLLARARAAEIARAAEHAAMFELSATRTRRSRWASLTHWSERATRPTTAPATAASPCFPVPCCA